MDLFMSTPIKEDLEVDDAIKALEVFERDVHPFISAADLVTFQVTYRKLKVIKQLRKLNFYNTKG